jgi:hypothetical protein
MSRTVELLRVAHFRSQGRRYKFYVSSRLERVPTFAIEGVLSAFLITLGLVSGIVAIAPQQLLERIPVIHVAVAFFVPFAMLFALTDLHLRAVTTAVIRGFVAALILGGCLLAISNVSG